jgi:hypothetical protein
MKNVAEKCCIETQNTHFKFNNLFYNNNKITPLTR